MSGAIHLPPHLAEANRPITRMKGCARELAPICAAAVRAGKMKRSEAVDHISAKMRKARDAPPPFGPLTPEAEAERTIDAGRIHATAAQHLDEALAALDGKPSADGRPAGVKPKPGERQRPRTISGEALMGTVFAPLRWALRHVIPQGYCVFAGPPKLGKSWLCYQLAHAIASGGMLFGQDAEQAPVLALALEDGGRRAQDRLRKVLDGAPMPKGLELAFDWPKLHEGGLDAIAAWAADKPGAVVVLDTLAKVKPNARVGANAYDADNEIHAPLHRICRERNMTIIAVTHLRKSRGEDWVEAISGSMGISGTADTIMVLERQRGSADGVLKITGRDVEEQELALRLDKEQGRWSCMGDAAHFRGSENSRKIVAALRKAGPQGMTPNEVAERSGVARGAVRTALHRMLDKGEVVNLGSGRYVLPSL